MKRKLQAKWTLESPASLSASINPHVTQTSSKEGKTDGEAMLETLIEECFPIPLDVYIGEEIRKEIDAEIIRSLEEILWRKENEPK